nr:glycosyltransferase family 1 protein [Sphingomonas sp. CFBP 8760]
MTGHTNVPGATYINVSHTDFDLASHARWIRRQALKPVYLLHDLIPLTHGEHCRPRAVQRHRGRVIGALRHGAGIVVSSTAVADDLTTFTRQQRLETPPVLVAPLAGADLGSRRVRPKVSNRYFLCVGTIESRKNHILLLKIWQRLRMRLGAATPRLVIVGQWGRRAEAVADMLTRDRALAEHVSLVKGCTDDDLAELINGACAMLMPSLAEGYGLPMAEALTLGVPVIASDLPCYREVGQGAPCLLDPHDVAAWTDLIAGFGDTCPRYRRQIMQISRFRPTTWVEHFARVERWLPRLAGSTESLSAPLPRMAAPIMLCEGVL